MGIKKFAIRFWWFIVLLLVSGYFLLSTVLQNRQNDKEIAFAIDNVDDVNRITIAHAHEEVVLQRSSTNGWLVNYDSPASIDAVNALLRVISRLQVDGPVPINANDSLLHLMQKQGTQIELFSNRRNLRRYTVATTDSEYLISIGHLEKAKRVYRISLPRYDGAIVDLFKTVPEYWIGNQVPTPSYESITAVQVEVPADLEQSYRIDIGDDGQYRLFHIFSGTEIDAFEESRVRHLITSLTQIPYASIVSMSDEERAAVIYSDPDFIYTIYSTESSKFELKVYPIPVDEYIDELGRPVNVDLNRVYVIVSGSKQVFVVNYIEMHSVLQGLSSFLS